MADSSADDNPMLKLVQSMASAVSYKENNVEMNRKVWDRYAKDWSKDTTWVVSMAENLGQEWKGGDMLEHVGDEWSDRASLQEVIDGWILPYIGPGSVVAEIGIGGGRVAVRVAPKCAEFHGLDISSEMMKRSKAAIASLPAPCAKCEFHNLRENKLPPSLQGRIDFCYSFDCLPHCDAHTIYAYLLEFRSALKPGAHALVHTSNLCAPGGFARFAKQKEATVQGFCWVSPDMVRTMVSNAGLELVRESKVGGQNIYYNRDFICIVRKPEDA